MRTQIIRQKINKSYVTHWIEKKYPVNLDLSEKVEKRKEQKKLQAIEQWRTDWKIYVDWLGWVSL